MALITHLCTRCGHPDYRRDLRSAAPGPCTCGCRCTPGAPEVRPTWDTAGRRVERIMQPGEAMCPGVVTCRCQACKDLHTQLTADSQVDARVDSPREPSTRQLRKWAAENGIDCPARGRIPERVTEAYRAVHA